MSQDLLHYRVCADLSVSSLHSQPNQNNCLNLPDSAFETSIHHGVLSVWISYTWIISSVYLQKISFYLLPVLRQFLHRDRKKLLEANTIDSYFRKTSFWHETTAFSRVTLDVYHEENENLPISLNRPSTWKICLMATSLFFSICNVSDNVPQHA